MNPIRRLFLAAAAGTAAILAGCGDSGTNPTPTAATGGVDVEAVATKLQKPVRIGVSIPAADHGWTAGVVWWAKQAMELYPD
ncbi:MAG: sugar ABC transporter substrate-binding protein, partial [Phycisphaeraceae bacterium]|nr:sugar ABC transporter substrate-binding protein [Phycisphaeraceae bacterium]